MREVLLNYEKVDEQKVHIVNHGFDMMYFDVVGEERVLYLKEKYAINGHYPVIGMISRFTELKGIQYVIPAFRKLLNIYPNALLMMFNAVGDYKKEILNDLEQLPPDSYRTIPFESDVAAVYRLFDVFIQVSTDRLIEAFGQTYVEALASGVPAIYTLSGIATDFICDQRNAFVVPFRSSDDIYHQLIKILSDYGCAQSIAEQGKRDVQHLFSLTKMIDSLEQVYDC